MTEEQRIKHREYARRWREAHKHEERIKNLKFRLEHPEYMQQWRERNPRYHSQWNARNRDHRREYLRRWKRGEVTPRKRPIVTTPGFAMTYDEIAARLGMERTAVRRIEREALAKLKAEDLRNLIELAQLLEDVRARRQYVEIRK